MLSSDQAEALVAEVNRFKKGYLTADGKRVVGDVPVEAMDAEDVGREALKVKK